MSEALAAVSAAAPSSPGKGLMEQENAAAEPTGENAFASLVEALLPTAATAIPGAELPTGDVPLPGEIAAGLALTGASSTPLSPPLGDWDPALTGGAAQQWLANMRAMTLKTADAGGAARIGAEAAGVDSTALAESGFSAAGQNDTAFEVDLDVQQVLGSAAAPTSTSTSTTAGAALPDAMLHGLLALGASAASAAATDPPKLVLDSKLPVLNPAFADSFSAQVTVLVEHGVKHAQLSLNPADLGPIEVRISFHQDQATIQFASHHPAARDAMAEALPRLREMLDGAGVRLGESGVFAQLPQREQPAGTPAGAGFREAAADASHASPESSLQPLARMLRLVDAYV